MGQQFRHRGLYGNLLVRHVGRMPTCATWHNREQPMSRTRPSTKTARKGPGTAARLLPASTPATDVPIAPTPPNCKAAVILKNVIQTAVIPRLFNAHGLVRPESPPAIVHPDVAELADRLIAADPAAADQMLAGLQTDNGGIWPLYATLFEPVARRLGDLWSEDSCTEFAVTLGLCRLQTIVRRLGSPEPFRSAEHAAGPAALIVPQPGEVHRLGMALDFEILSHAGWAPQCNYPPDDTALQDLLTATWYDALDLSLSVAFQRLHWLPRLATTIVRARRASRNPALVVVVGGRAFVERRKAGWEVGADLASVTSLHVGRLILQAMVRRGSRPLANLAAAGANQEGNERRLVSQDRRMRVQCSLM